MSNEQENCNEDILTEEPQEAILKQFDAYITVQVKKAISQYPSFVHQEVKDLEVDEITQRVRIKFWRILKKGHIRSPLAYVKTIIYSEIIDTHRRQKVTQALPTGESEEYHEVLNVSDPADTVIEQMETTALLNKVVQLVLELPPRQRQAMLCQLQDQVDDLVQLVDAFQRQSIDIASMQWPREKAEKQLLRASLSAARRNLARNMEKDEE